MIDFKAVFVKKNFLENIYLFEESTGLEELLVMILYVIYDQLEERSKGRRYWQRDIGIGIGVTVTIIEIKVSDDIVTLIWFN